MDSTTRFPLLLGAILFGAGAAHGLLAGCGGGGSGTAAAASGSSSGGGDTSSPGVCPPLDQFTGATCSGAQVGPTCPGTVSCECGSTQIKTATSCVCGDDPVIQGGKAWTCEDDCSKACDPDGGTPDAGPAPPCETFCIHQNAASCSDAMSVDDCKAKTCVAFPEAKCQPAWEALIQCFAAADIICDAQGHATFPGCEDEQATLTGCI